MDTSTTTLSQTFFTEFQHFRAGVSHRLDQLSVSSQNEDGRMKLSDEIRRMRKKLNDVLSELPSYDRRIFESQLKEIEERLAALQLQSKGKTKFAFKKSAGSLAKKEVSVQSPKTDLHDINSPPTNVLAKPKEYQVLTTDLLSDSYLDSGLTISNLSHCIVNVTTSNLTAIHIQNVKDSLLLLGEVKGSLLAHHLERCTILVASHQLRIHSSKNTLFFLGGSANAVIEDCTNMVFTDYPPDIDDIVETNRMIDVQDFSHIKSTPSPNWNIVTPDTVLPSREEWVNVLGYNGGGVDRSMVENFLTKFLPSRTLQLKAPEPSQADVKEHNFLGDAIPAHAI